MGSLKRIIGKIFENMRIEYRVIGKKKRNSLMPTFDPEHMRVMDHALRIIDTFLGNYKRYFGNLRIALWTKKLE